MYNFITKVAYTGENAMILSMLDYASPYYLTYKQAQSVGLQVRKGEHGIVLKRVVEVKEKNKKTGKIEKKKVARGFVVFNVSQCDEVKSEVAA